MWIPFKTPRRRILTAAFVLGITCAAATVLTTMAAQQVPAVPASRQLPVVAFLGGGSFLDSFLKGMSDIGYVADRDFRLESCQTDGLAEKEAQCAGELIALRPNVIVTLLGAIELKKRTNVVPIVLMSTPEALALRVIDSLEHPGGNITGTVSRSALRTEKEMSLLKAVVPGLRRVAALTGGYSVGAAQAFAAANGLQLNIVDFKSPDQLEESFEKLAASSPQALFVGGGGLTLVNMSKIASLAAARKWPSISENRELPASGGLMSYGGHGDARQVARYVDRILKGAKPSDLPAEVQEQRWALVINIGAAERLGLTIPDAVLAQAAEIIR